MQLLVVGSHPTEIDAFLALHSAALHERLAKPELLTTIAYFGVGSRSISSANLCFRKLLVSRQTFRVQVYGTRTLQSLQHAMQILHFHHSLLEPNDLAKITHSQHDSTMCLRIQDDPMFQKDIAIWKITLNLKALHETQPGFAASILLPDTSLFSFLQLSCSKDVFLEHKHLKDKLLLSLIHI